ncbi:MAG: S8/S53 family peptidase [Alphaproteobacteria bacterium]
MPAPAKTWFLTTAGVPRAWQMVFGGAAVDPANPDWARIAGWDWAGVTVGQVDHGYTLHPATLGSVHPKLGRNYMDPGSDDPRDPMDYAETFGVRGHGTRTGSTLAGFDPQQGYLGVAPKVPLIPYRVTNRSVLDLPGGTLLEPEGTNVAKAIRHAVDQNECPVISISLGSLFGWQAMGEAVDHAYDNGVIVVAAAGQVISEVVYPGKYPQTVSAGGIRPGNWPYWTYRPSGARPDIWAPGAAVWRAQAAPPDNGTATYRYDWGEGTSYATAVVAGLAALFVRRFADDLARKGYDGWRRVELFRALLKRNAKTVRGTGQDGAVVQFPGVLNTFPAWPKPDRLKRAQPDAAAMHL